MLIFWEKIRGENGKLQLIDFFVMKYYKVEL